MTAIEIANGAASRRRRVDRLFRRPMIEALGPGWTVEDCDGSPSSNKPPTCMYMLWAPRPGRPHYEANWFRVGGGHEYSRAATAAAALACFPDDREGRKAKRLVLAALTPQHEEGPA